MDMIEHLTRIAIEKSRAYPDDCFVIRGLWRIDYRYKPNAWERDLSYSMVLAQTIWQGCCYLDYGAAHIDESFLGKDARKVKPQDIGTAIAILDAMYAVFDKSPDATFIFNGSASDKAIQRAQIVVDQVLRELEKLDGHRVLNIGVMGNFIKQLRNKGVEVVGCDFDPDLIDKEINDAKVESGNRTLDLIKNCDIALATGMTLSTQTLEDIISTVKEHNKKLILFAATGAHFAEEYCDAFGVDVVVSEPQPQYMFQGGSMINIYRRKI